MELIYLRGADDDIQEIYTWYEETREGLGEEFLARLNASLGLLRQNPYMGKVHLRPIRRLLIPKCDDGVFYSVEGSELSLSR